MTPGARVSAAIEIIADIQSGLAAEQALTRWARNSRFAGSKDRAAVRDLVFDHMRTWRSDAVRGGGDTPRQRMIGRLRAEGADLDALFTGAGHAPSPLTQDERDAGALPERLGDIWNLPDWLVALWQASLGPDAARTAMDLQARAPVTLRVNAALATVAQAASALAAENVETRPNPLSPNALTVVTNPRRVRQSGAFSDGWVELQDASSQAAVDAVRPGARVLDYCAGGGGKALALAALGRDVHAHDIDARRMADIPARADRAQAQITVIAPENIAQAGTFDVVFCDAPCSGSGAWRRSPAGKWALTADRLDELMALQDAVLDAATAHVAPGGTLVYATCSVLRCENAERVAAFLERHPDWHCDLQLQLPVSADGDGFFTAHLTQGQAAITQP